jgi:formamidopyrimidine-DNA glycosylase
VRPLVGRLRTPLDAAALRNACAGRQILDLRRRAKFLVLELEDRHALILHLGMTGTFHLDPAAAPHRPHDRVTWELDDGTSLRFQDPRRFGSVECCRLPAAGAEPPSLASLGPEPLAPAFDGAHLHHHAHGRRTAVKAWIMQQELVAGVGNIYANEACFRARLDPRTPAGHLSRHACDRLAAEIKGVLADAIRAGGTTIRDFRSADGSEGHFSRQLQIYGHAGEDCRRCGPGHSIERLRLAGRATYRCPHCQR